MTTTDDERSLPLLDDRKHEGEPGYQALYRRRQAALYGSLGAYLAGTGAPALSLLAMDNPSLTQRAIVAGISLGSGIVAYLASVMAWEGPAQRRLDAYVARRLEDAMRAEAVPPAMEPAGITVPDNVISLEERVAEKKSA